MDAIQISKHTKRNEHPTWQKQRPKTAAVLPDRSQGKKPTRIKCFMGVVWKAVP